MMGSGAVGFWQMTHTCSQLALSTQPSETSIGMDSVVLILLQFLRFMSALIAAVAWIGALAVIQWWIERGKWRRANNIMNIGETKLHRFSGEHFLQPQI